MSEGAKSSLCEKLECPVCLEFLEIPIRQCVIGHSFCTKCIDPNNIKKCPECRSDILETRNYKLEELLESMSFPCVNKTNGCPYVLDKELMKLHISECRYRRMSCEGKAFCNWKCTWQGHDILEHFRAKHIGHTSMEFSTQVSVAYNSATDFTDIQLIPAHYQLFWYKHKIDTTKQKGFWCFQYIGPRKQAAYYYYEFEFFSTKDAVRKYKITEYCQSDVEDINKIFESEKCIAISLNALKTYVDENNEFSFRFRIMKIKKDNDSSNKKAVDVKAKTGVGIKKLNQTTPSNSKLPANVQPMQMHPYMAQNWSIPWLPAVPLQPPSSNPRRQRK